MALEKDKAFQKKPRWYKYRLIRVKIYALCYDESPEQAKNLIPNYLLSRLNGSELQRHNDFLNAKRKFRALLCNILNAQDDNEPLRVRLLPIPRQVTQKNSESQMAELVRVAIKYHLKTSKYNVSCHVTNLEFPQHHESSEVPVRNDPHTSNFNSRPDTS